MPRYFRNLKTADVLSAYFRMGFVRVNNRGRHHKLRHHRLNLTMIVHRRRGEILQGTLADAVRRSRVTDAELWMEKPRTGFAISTISRSGHQNHASQRSPLLHQPDRLFNPLRGEWQNIRDHWLQLTRRRHLDAPLQRAPRDTGHAR